MMMDIQEDKGENENSSNKKDYFQSLVETIEKTRSRERTTDTQANRLKKACLK